MMAGRVPSKFVVELFYDVVSPYSYFAFEELLRLQAGEWRDFIEEVVLRPFFLGGVMQASGNKPPLTVPAKGRYMMRLDLPRASRVLGLSLRVPSRFPASTLLAQRVLTALDRHDRPRGQARLREVTKRMWQVYWEEDGDITDPQTVRAALVAAGCSEAEASLLLEQAKGDHHARDHAIDAPPALFACPD